MTLPRSNALALGRREGLDPGPYRAPDSALARARQDPFERNVAGSRSRGVDEFVGDPRSDASTGTFPVARSWLRR